MKKMMKIAAIVAGILIMNVTALPTFAGASEMSTEVTYFAGDMNAENPDCYVSAKYTVVVPSTVKFGGSDEYTVEFSGITAKDLTVSASQRIAMQSVEGVTEAIVEFEAVEVSGDIMAEQKKSSPVSVGWESAPTSGIWTGAITYSVK